MRLWELWKGQNHFCLGGWIILPGNPCPSALTLPTILTVSTLFCVGECPRLNNFGAYLAAMSGILMLASATSFLRTALMDPGYLPRAPLLAAMSLSSQTRSQARKLCELYAAHISEKRARDACAAVEDPEAAEHTADGGAEFPLQGFEALESFEPDEEPTAESIQQAELFWKELYPDVRLKPLKICTTCDIRQPRGASHCKECDNCVMGFDHHCHWTGSCVGARNHTPFVCFVLSTALLAGLIALVSILDLLACLGASALSGAMFHGPASWLLNSLLLSCGVFGAALASSKLLTPFYKSVLKKLLGKSPSQHPPTFGDLVWLGCVVLLMFTSTLWVLLAVVLGLLPVVPLLLAVLTLAPLPQLTSMAQQQVMNLGHGVNIKILRTRERSGEVVEDPPWDPARIIDFLAQPMSESLAPMCSELPEIGHSVDQGHSEPDGTDLEGGGCASLALPILLSRTAALQSDAYEPVKERAKSCPEACKEDPRAPHWFMEEP